MKQAYRFLADDADLRDLREYDIVHEGSNI